MTAQTRMIIVTSNGDIIQQLSLHNAPNTRIIELDNDTPGTSLLAGDHNLANSDLRAELSQFNCTNDELYKRALESIEHHSSKPAKIPKKSADLICAICGDRAIGYNYDVPSCASCKAFFSRNANQTMDKIRCLTGEGQCSVADETRPKCRLERCLAVGMRKDFMLSDEVKQRRKKRLTEMRSITSQSTNALSDANRAPNFESASTASDEIDRLLMDMAEDNGNILFDENDDLNQMGYLLLETLSVEDWIAVESTSALIGCSYIAHHIGLRFISFHRQIPEFERFDGDDRFVLIKYNLHPLFPILKCFYGPPTCHPDRNVTNEDEAQMHRVLSFCFGSGDILNLFVNLPLALGQLTERDPAIISLLLTVLMFSEGLSINEDQPALKDSRTVNQAQSYYTRVLWNYMKNKWGETETCKRFSKLVTMIFRLQVLCKTLRDYFRSQLSAPNTVDQLAPLMQSVLNIS